jgi:hypothetical protein
MKFLLLLILLNLTTFAKTLKFHPPKTEAEKTLDLILKIKNGLEKNIKMKQEDMFTKEFNADYKRQEDEALNSEDCKKYGDMSCYPWDCNYLTCAQDTAYHYLFYTEKFSHNTDVVKVMSVWDNNYSTFQLYILRKENKKWKIDGINCNDGYVLINWKDKK